MSIGVYVVRVPPLVKVKYSTLQMVEVAYVIPTEADQ
jgi:hypothetical protein